MVPDPSPPRERAAPDRTTRAWRAALLLPTLLIVLALALLAPAAVGLPRDPLSGAVMLLFWLVLSWHAFIAVQYGLGLVVALAGRRAQGALERRAAGVPATASGRSRTAAIVPIHAEDPEAVFAALRVMALSLARAGGDGGDIDLFVLSDTQDPAIAAAEAEALAAVQAWRARGPAGLPAIRYRRRGDNSGRKAGNVAEFCRTYGPAYDFMIVLDADSLMSGAAMRRLVRLMEEHPRVGLIQTVSYAAGRETLFTRVQQFAVRLYAPLAIRSLDAWQGADGSYWGHNAILRVRAFADAAALPVLPGRAPLGGEILCHDIVEGALLRRAGWELRLLPELSGTWEEMPTNLIDLLGRERRWCQGNLQHLKVLPWPGLRLGSRMHLATGILAYLAAPLWVAFLALALLEALRAGGPGLLAYGLATPGPAGWALGGLAGTIFAAPKALSLAYILGSPARRAAFGGAGRLLASALLEQIVWLTLWPVLTLFNAGAVVTTFLGRVVRWDAQARAERRVPLREALRLQGGTVAAGAILAGLLALADPLTALWLAPVALGLVAAPLVCVLSSRGGLGHRARALGLFLTEDDCTPAPELRDLALMRGAGVPPAPAMADAPWFGPGAAEESEAPATR